MSGSAILDLLARLAVLGALAGALWAVLAYVWRQMGRRVDALEKWRRDHEGAHVQILLSLQSLEIHSEATRAALARVEGLLSGVAVCVATHRQSVKTPCVDH